MKKSHMGLGVIAVMSVKGTATLAATFLLPTWRARFVALAVIIAIAAVSIIAHRRRRKAGVAAADIAAESAENAEHHDSAHSSSEFHQK